MVTTDPNGTARDASWRTRDIMVTSIIGVAFAVVFWAWNTLFLAVQGALPAAIWLADLLYGMWFVPAVLAAMIVRKPGAAFFAEFVAAGLSMVLGSIYAADALLSGALQGLAVELVFLVTGYRVFTFAVIAVAALAAVIPAFVHDWIIWYPTVEPVIQALRLAMMAISAVVITAAGSIRLERRLRETGVLQGFPG